MSSSRCSNLQLRRRRPADAATRCITHARATIAVTADRPLTAHRCGTASYAASPVVTDASTPQSHPSQ